MNNREAIALLRNLEDALDSYCELNEEGKTAFRMAIESLELFGNSEHLPSAQPERKKGKWEEVQFRTIPYNRISKAKKCSVCGKRKDKYVTWNFCPNCGADMRGESE